MPIYEYQCRSCGSRSEVLQRISDPPPADCEACGGELKKLISAPSFQFKGTGWYVTDYAGKGKDKGTDKGEDKKEGQGKDKESGAKEAKSEDKPSKSESKGSSKSVESGASKPERISSGS